MSYHIREFSSDLYIHNELNFVPHSHIHRHVELVYLTKGAFTAILDNKEYQVKAGDLFVVFPYQIHYYYSDKKAEGYIAVFSSGLHPKLKSVFRKKTPFIPILHDNELPSDIADNFKKTHDNYKECSFYSTLVSDACLLEIIGETLPLLSYNDNNADHDTVKQILIYCMENYTNTINLKTLSHKFCLSESYISRIFHERMHTSYIDFINKLRVSHACNLLEKGSNITEIAFVSGFSSISTFNRAFLKHMKMAPRDYIKINQS